MTDRINQLVDYLSNLMPVEVFAFFGALFEEIIAPIPSPLVMTTAGGISLATEHPFSYLFVLAILGGVGKTFGAWILYFIADKAEDVVTSRFGKFLGISHSDVEGIGKHFTGGIRDWIVLLALRSAPIVPSAPVSVVCGLIKIKLKVYLTTTFIGTSIRNFIFLYIGYTGLSNYEAFLSGANSLEKVLQIVIVLIILIGLFWLYRKRQKGNIFEIFNKISKK